MLSVDEKSVVLGDQRPRILRCPKARTSAGGEVAELAAEFGLVLDPWQRLVLDKALGERRDGRWAAFEVGLMVSRQNGKGAILEALELAALFLFGTRLIIHSAHEFRTAKEAMRRLEFLLLNSGEKFKANRSHGEESLEILSGPNVGARVMFQTRTKAGGLGLSGDLVILDEAMIISSEAIQALMPTLSARPNPQVWYTGSAVDELIHANCEVFTGVRQRALDGSSPRLCYLEWSCELGADLRSQRERARANPSYGIRITPEYIDDEFESFKFDARGFGVQRLGIGYWPELSEKVRSEIPAKSWVDMADQRPVLRDSPAVGLHRDPETGVWVIVAAQYTDTGRAHLEVGYSRAASSGQVVAAVVELVSAWDPVAVALKRRGDAAAVESELVKAGVEPEMVDGGRWAQWCGGFLNAALSHRLSHSNQDDLNTAAGRAVRHDLPAGGFIWDESAAGSSAGVLVAATLAHGALAANAVTRKRMPSAPVIAKNRGNGADSGQFDFMKASF